MAPVAQPLVRQSTLSRKRNATDSPVNQDAVSLSPGKRPKVTFGPNAEVRPLEEWDKAPDLVREEVRHAIERHGAGDNTGYDRVREIYTKKSTEDDAPTAVSLKNHTTALLSCAAALNRSCSTLVRAVLKSEWLGKDDVYVALFVRFLGNLVSAQGSFMGEVLQMLVENLTSAPPSSGRILNQPLITSSQVYNRAHAALKYLLQLIPSASNTLRSVLINVFPHCSDSKRAHIIYVKNLLKVLEYVPELRSETLGLITERLVKIDVQVQVDLEDLAEDVGDGLVQDIPQLRSDLSEEIDEEAGDSESDTSDGSVDAEAQRAKEIIANVEKMDSILDVLFSYYTVMFSSSSIDSREVVLDILLSQFATIILPTYRSRHTQFLLFHFAQISPSLIDNFVGACVHIAFEKSRPSLIRQSAASYLASFVARGIHVPSQIVRDVFDYIGSQLSILRLEHEVSCRGPDLRRYSTFYSLVQALLYIFCFRWRDLETRLTDPDEDSPSSPVSTRLRPHFWVPGIKETFSKNIFSPLNPLKVCSPAIVSEFARISNHLGLIYVFHLIENNKRLRLPHNLLTPSSSPGDMLPQRETALSMRKDEAYQQLDEYFPFDPYHLPRSKRWIEADYREWKGVPGLDDKQDSLESDSEEGSESEADDDDEPTATDEDESD